MNFPTGCTHDQLAAALYWTSSSKYLPESNATNMFLGFVWNYIDNNFEEDPTHLQQSQYWYENAVHSIENMQSKTAKQKASMV